MAVRIAVMAGSVRQGSHNAALAALAAQRLRAAGAEVTEIDLAALALPLYCQDVEHDAFPPAAATLKAMLARSDGLLIATPEHNGSVSSLVKNALDWASRPTDGEGPLALSAYRGKSAAIVAASIGPFGGLRALAHLRQILGTVQMMVIPEQLSVPFADRAFDAGGALADPLTNTILDALVSRLVDTARRMRN